MINLDDLFIVSGETLINLATAWDQGDAHAYYEALDDSKKQRIEPGMDHVCMLKTEHNDNGSITIRLLKFAPIEREV